MTVESKFKVETINATAEMQAIKELYRICRYNGPVEPEDVVVLAWHDSTLVGVARLVKEGANNLLRGMYIHPEYHRRGIGTKILISFAKLTETRDLDEIFLTCGQHLEKFYEQIGFKKVESDLQAPQFLVTRKEGYEKTYGPQIIMRRTKC